MTTRHTRRKTGYRAVVILLVLLIVACTVSYSSQHASSDGSSIANESSAFADLTQQIQQLSDGTARISTDAKTGIVRFIGTDLLNAIPSAAQANCSPETAARSFLSTYGRLFGISDQANELEVIESNTVDGSRSFTRFQQVYDDIPVLGGELIVQVDARGSVISANSEVLPKISLNVDPAITLFDARQTALGVVARAYELDTSALTASEPRLWIYNPVILGLNWDVNSLVWRMDVMSVDGEPIRELVLVDAQRGFVALHFNQIETAKNRSVYSAKSAGVCTSNIPGTLRRSEGQAAIGYTDVDNAYTYTGYTYDFYSNEHGRDSINNAGMAIISTVDYDPNGGCDFQNAGWNGAQMIFGTGFTSACDVVGHELTHGVTDYESNLIYYMQSGAINEGFSDIWGEFIELTYNPGAPSERWLCGENLAMGAIRSMKDPPFYGSPDKMTSPNYYCGAGDNGGVHYNSGIANKAAYLMVDGGTFNGYTITGMGINKTADLFYEVQTNLLTSGSNYGDLYNALQQAAINLGYNSSEMQTVKNAIDATEMNLQPTSCPVSDAPVCDSGMPYDLFFDNMENPASGNWTFGSIAGGNYWSYESGYAASGQYCLYGYDYNRTADYYAAMSNNMTLPAGRQYYLHFKHLYSFDDPNYDGGVVEYSTNGGSTWNDAGPLFINNGYNGTIRSGSGNPLAGRSAFVACSNDYYLYGSSRLNLSSLAGRNVKFRFRIGTDYFNDNLGWLIDDVRIYTCGYYLNAIASSGGTISSPGQGLTGPYPPGSLVNISVTPDSCYGFVNWSGSTSTIANTSAANTTITMNGNYVITANFGLLPTGYYGDANRNNRIDIGDYLAVKRMYLMNIPIDTGGDANMNGKIDIGDYLLVKRMYLLEFPLVDKYEVRYDFTSGNSSNKWARNSSIAAPPPALNKTFETDTGWTNATTVQYNNISATDGIVWNITGTSGKYAALQCKFTIIGSAANITSIGVALNGSAKTNGDALQLWAWNFSSGSWKQLGIYGSDATNFSMTTSIATYSAWTAWGKVYTNYIDGNGYMYILANLNNAGENLYVDYIKLTVAHP